MPIYSFPVIGNPSSASTRSVMMALGLVMLSLLSGFGIIYLIGLLGADTSNLFWIPVLSTAPAVVFAMFAVVKDEAKREANFRDMSILVSDALILATGIELGERDIRRMVDGDHIDIEDGTLRIDEQRNGRNKIMVLVRDNSGTDHETGHHVDPVFDSHGKSGEDVVEHRRGNTTSPANVGSTALPVQKKDHSTDRSSKDDSPTTSIPVTAAK